MSHNYLHYYRFSVFLTLLCCSVQVYSNSTQQTDPQKAIVKDQLIYQTLMNNKSVMADWVMEGPGTVEFKQGWMQMYSPNESMHHVFWCPQEFPESFIAQWQVQNLSTTAGLVIVFFSAAGINGEDIFANSLAIRDGTFTHYTNGDINNYHISYYANAAHNLDRPQANLRKNNGFNLVQEGRKGIPAQSTGIHEVQLVKNGNHILMSIDDRVIIDYLDKDASSSVLGAGKIGFRQMQWTKFKYRNFKVWSVK